MAILVAHVILLVHLDVRPHVVVNVLDVLVVQVHANSIVVVVYHHYFNMGILNYNSFVKQLLNF